jgi:signal transduction histidine kinase
VNTVLLEGPDNGEESDVTSGEAAAPSWFVLIDSVHDVRRKHAPIAGRMQPELGDRGASADVVITVRDSGPELEPTSLDRPFDAFYTTKPDGLGMGLAISISIVESHGGWRWAPANTPQGAVLRFTLPLGRAA